MQQRAGSVLAAGHFQQVITELGFHRALDHVHRCAEHHGVEFLDHLTRAEGAQVVPMAEPRVAAVHLIWRAGDLTGTAERFRAMAATLFRATDR